MQKNQNYMQAESAQLMFDLAHTPEVCSGLSSRYTVSDRILRTCRIGTST